MAAGVRIPIKAKIFALVGFLIFFALLGIIFRTSQIFRGDKEAFVKELSAKLASSVAKNTANRISSLQDKLIIFISSRESLAHTGAKVEDQTQVLFSRYQEFISVAMLNPDAQDSLKVDWVLRNPQGGALPWPSDYEKNLISNLNMTSATTNKRAFWRGVGPDGQPLSILGFAVQVVDVRKTKNLKPGNSTVTAWIVGVLSSKVFDDLIGDFSTGLNTGMIVDDQGIAIAHSDPLMRWRNLKSHPLVAEILKNNRPASTGDYTDMDGRAVIGSFELIPKINLGVVVTTPRDKAFEAAQILFKNIVFIGAIILVASLATAVLMSNYMTGPLQRLAELAQQIGGGDFKVDVDVKTNDEIGDLAQSFSKMGKGLLERDEALAAAQGALVQSEKMSAFGQLSAGIAHEVKNPLAGILGHAQLAMGKAQSDDMKRHLEVIEKETRRCKAIVENLMKFARAEKAQLQPTDLAQVIQDTINLVDHQLSLAGCKILKDLQPCPMVEANGNQLQQVLLNLMVNASHAMENCPTKNVTVRLVKVGNKAQIQIEDTGVGIPPEIQKKIFEPFFTTKPAGKGTGLGLSVSIGIVKDHKGEIYLKSVMNKGTTFFIDIPILANAKLPEKGPEKPQAPPPKPSEITFAESKAPPKSEPRSLPADIPTMTATKSPASPQEDIFFGTKSPSVTETKESDVTLGGKAPLESTAAKVPQAPPPEEITNTNSSSKSSTEFKVKISRPKLKV